MICNMSLQIMRWRRPSLYKAGYPFGGVMDWYLSFRWAARVSASNNLEYVRDAKHYSEKYYVCGILGAIIPIVLRRKRRVKK